MTAYSEQRRFGFTRKEIVDACDRRRAECLEIAEKNHAREKSQETVEWHSYGLHSYGLWAQEKEREADRWNREAALIESGRDVDPPDKNSKVFLTLDETIRYGIDIPRESEQT